MRESESAYAALGLADGADRKSIEEAYRRLIKRHHPDREGGDANRAAEINWAYSELRGSGPGGDSWQDGLPLPVPGRRFAPPARPRARRFGFMAILISMSALLGLQQGWWSPPDLPRWKQADWQAAAVLAPRTRVRDKDAIEADLSTGAIVESVARASGLARRGDVLGMSFESRSCHSRLRDDPSIVELDRCLAFDDAVAAVSLRESGPFSPSAMTARQMAAASLFSEDYMAIERRLDRVRAEVDLLLAPGQQEGPKPQREEEEAAPAAGAGDGALPNGFSDEETAGPSSDQRRLFDASNLST
jgi:hypothetical protein